MQMNMSRLLLVNTSAVILFAACLGKLIHYVPSLLIKEHVINFLYGQKMSFYSIQSFDSTIKKKNCILQKLKKTGIWNYWF